MKNDRATAIAVALEAKQYGDETPFMDLVHQVHEFMTADEVRYELAEAPLRLEISDDLAGMVPGMGPIVAVPPGLEISAFQKMWDPGRVQRIIEPDEPEEPTIDVQMNGKCTAVDDAPPLIEVPGLAGLVHGGMPTSYNTKPDGPEKKPANRWDGEDGEKLKALWTNPEIRTSDICQRFGVTAQTIYKAVRQLGLPKRKRGGKPKSRPKANRRFTEKPASDPETVVGLAADHPAVIEGRPLFPGMVKKANEVPRVLISGINNTKLGSRVTKGPWRGMPLFQLSLPERTTCPKTCYHWRTCFGNAMHLARRHEPGPELLEALENELATLSKKHPGGYVVRLHVLGDFYSRGYVEFWALMLQRHPALRIFGYTAWPRSSEIGSAIAARTARNWDRFAIRFSSAESKPQGTTTIFRQPEAANVPEGIVCPMETEATDCCGTCGLCWSAAARKKTIVFVAHGNLGNAWSRKDAEGRAGSGNAPGMEETEEEGGEEAPPARLEEVAEEEERPFSRPTPPKFRPAQSRADVDVETPAEKREKKAAQDAAVAEFLETKGARRFEPGASAAVWMIVDYLKEHGHDVARSPRNPNLYKLDKEIVGAAGLIKAADVHRIKEGLPPIQRAVNGRERA